ncbi:aspartate aminotransferase family protein [bacterium]|nr:aspartate aminotransferase family protein [bacterium]
MKTIDRAHLTSLMEREQRLFREEHPRSLEIFERARSSLLGGVPMNWMSRWAGEFPIFVAEASGARFSDVDGREYVDLCLGDTGAMTGHSPPAAAAAIGAQAARGITLMLPTEDSVWVGEEMARRFGLPYWQFTLSATDANRFVIRLARHITGRSKVLVYNGCYHGSADETVIGFEDGAVIPRRGSVGPPVDPRLTTRVVEFNDLPALEAALAEGDVACVLAEPVMTNIGIIFPGPGYHDALRRMTRDTGTLLVIDETHTFCTGPGGYTAEYGLEPDVITIGKPIGSGVPSGAYGVSEEVAERISSSVSRRDADVGGVGGTLAGNALSLAAIKATLSEVLTDEAFVRMIALGERFEEGVRNVITDHGMPWHVHRLGCRVEYRFQADPPRNGGEAEVSEDPLLDEYMHLLCLNRGILLTPFHNMALMSPSTTAADVDRHTEVFADAIAELLD